MKMNSDEFMKMTDESMGLKLIVAGMAGLIDEGYTPHQVLEIMDAAKYNTFHALTDLKGEVKQ